MTKLIRNGTTTTCYFGSTQVSSAKILCKIVEEKGQRAFIGKSCHNRFFSSNSQPTAECLKETEEVIKFIQNLNLDRIRPTVTPSSVPGCDSELLFGLGELAKRNDCLIQTHLSESQDVVKDAKKFFLEFPDEAAVLENHRLLTSNAIMAHCVHVDAHGRRLMLENRAGIAHCPLSNYRIPSNNRLQSKIFYMQVTGCIIRFKSVFS